MILDVGVEVGDLVWDDLVLPAQELNRPLTRSEHQLLDFVEVRLQALLELGVGALPQELRSSS